MTDEQLSAALRDAVPPLGPPLNPRSVLAAAQRRQRQRRVGFTAATGLMAASIVVGIAQVAPDRRTALPADDPTPCGSPFAGTDQERAVAVPHDGGRIKITLRLGDHVTVGWASCSEHGRLTTSPTADFGPITGSDAHIYSSPRPNPSGPPHGVVRPANDGVYSARYVAQRVGTVTLHGIGSLGSEGYVGITVEPLTEADGPLVSGRVDLSGLVSRSGPEAVLAQRTRPTRADGGAVVLELDAEGRFSAHLRPGMWSLKGISSAYGDGRAHCIGDEVVVLAHADVTGAVVRCTES